MRRSPPTTLTDKTYQNFNDIEFANIICHLNGISCYCPYFSNNCVSLYSLMVKAGEPTKANLSITPLPTTPSGTDVTLTIDVKSSSVGADSNYVVLRLSVVEKVSSSFHLTLPW